LIMLVTVGVVAAVGGELHDAEHLIDAVTSPVALIGLLVVALVGGPLTEELGWRGFALDRLQAHRRALSASLILGAVSIAWHIPLFFIEGTVQETMGFATVVFWAWAIQNVGLQILIAWAYNNCQRSILVAILVHFMANLTFTAVVGTDETLPNDTAVVWALVNIVVVTAVVAVWGRRHLRRQPPRLR
jgi:membrane protease YdiL (CAAX protease family)